MGAIHNLSSIKTGLIAQRKELVNRLAYMFISTVQEFKGSEVQGRLSFVDLEPCNLGLEWLPFSIVD